jgi:Lamin Tail Domain
MRRRTLVIASLLAPALAALVSFSCSESTDGVVPPTVPSTQDGATTEGGPTEGDAAVPTDGAVVTKSSVLINEIAADEEWVELVASGTTATDISGFRVADSEKDAGGPKLDEAVTLPSGTILSPKAYLIVQAGGLDGGGKACPDGGQSYCFKAEFGVSNKNGETIYLLDGSGAVVGTAIYPPKAAAAGETWGRLPSADPNGAFGVTAPTPGAANHVK